MEADWCTLGRSRPGDALIATYREAAVIGIKIFRNTLMLFAAVGLSACAGTGTIIDSPSVELTGVELRSASIRRQTFLLSFDIDNPNPFPLPVKSVDYEIIFDDAKFAEGHTQGSFTVPANSMDSFAISVDLDFLGSATHFKSLMSGGLWENIAYELRGRLAVDIPLVKPIAFSNSGVINMRQTASEQFD